MAFDDIRLTIASNSDKLLDMNYLRQVDKKINVMNTGIIVRKNEQIVYVSGIINKQEIIYRLPQFGAQRQEDKPIIAGKSIFEPRQFDFYFSDNSPGSVFLVTDFSPIGAFARKFFLSMMLAVFLILILTNGLLTYIVSRSIIRPIQSLKKAARQIKEGNLDFSVSCKSNDEIGQLCQAFEEMRSKLKESIELQLQYEDNRKELISNISHDLKTPIAAIKGYVAGIMDGVADTPEKTSKYIRTIHSKASDIDKLIDELFLFSKLDLKKELFNFERVEIKQYLQDSTEELKFDLGKEERGYTGIELNFYPENKEPLWVVADREKLKRVISNIVDNAVKYMDKEAGTIDITLMEDSDEFATIQIADNGQGIPKEALSLIFDRFYRADPSRNSINGGSGLGLAIARRIIEGHGGGIWAESEEGQGASIFFTLRKVKNS
ncbi:MAG: sensor histidine kinase [Eubacteriales bacterium]